MFAYLFVHLLGEEVTFYFAWMNFFTWSLVPVAAFGAFLFFHRPPGVTVDDSPYLPAYALIMALWTIFFCKVTILRCLLDKC